MDHHPELKLQWTCSLEKCQVNNLNHTTVNKFYDIYEELLNTYNIPFENIYNMDEKGILVLMLILFNKQRFTKFT
jgi:hypothetical protein